MRQKEIFPFFDAEGEGSYVPITGLTKISKTLDGRIIPENEDYIEVVTLFEGENPYEEKIEEVVLSENILEEEIEEVPEHYIDLNIKDPELLDNLIETSDEISWIQDGNIVLYWIDDLENIPYYYCGGEKERLCNDEITLDWANKITKFEYFPKRDDVWIVLTKEDGIFAIEIDPRSDRNVHPIYVGQGLDFRINDSNQIVVKDRGSFIELDL